MGWPKASRVLQVLGLTTVQVQLQKPHRTFGPHKKNPALSVVKSMFLIGAICGVSPKGESLLGY